MGTSKHRRRGRDRRPGERERRGAGNKPANRPAPRDDASRPARPRHPLFAQPPAPRTSEPAPAGADESEASALRDARAERVVDVPAEMAPEAATAFSPPSAAALPPEVAREFADALKPFEPPGGSREIPAAPAAAAEGWFPKLASGFADADGADAERARPVDEPRDEPLPEEKRMYIVMITPEVAPAAKVGGLADMVTGLGRELMKRGHRVELVVPMYHGLRRECVEDLKEYFPELPVPHGGQWLKEKVYSGVVSGLPAFFVTAGLYTLRPNIYGYDDDIRRFAYFTRAAMEFLFKSERRPHILHAHDWAVGLAPVMLYDIYQALGWNRTRAVFTIHNNECQGVTDDVGGVLGLAGLDWRNYHRPDRLRDDVRPGAVNLLKGAVVYSNFVTTVSPTYAGEIKTPLGGRGLHATLAAHSAKIGGVINGIDYEYWNPASDPVLAARYSSGDDFIEKYRNKYALREKMELRDCWRPIVSAVTRLTGQKGLALIRAAAEMVPDMEAQFVLLGAAPDPKVDQEFHRLAAELADNRDVHLWLGYNEDLAHLVYAGSDLFLMPSLYEPCGLAQMIAMRHGTVPIARRTGGLADTVVDPETSGRGTADANGFLFVDPTPEALEKALRRAIRMWYEDPRAFGHLARNGMRRDFSWRHPAKDYENIYNYIRA